MRAILYYLALFLAVGVGPGASLRAAFPVKGVLATVVLFESLGLLFFNLTVISFGHLGFPVTGGALRAYSILAVIISATMLLASYPGESIPKRVARIFSDLRNSVVQSAKSVSFINFLSWLLVFSYFLILVQVNRTHYFPSWDHFTYWLVDAKEIFLSGHLRVDGRISNLFSNSSYYPLHAVYLADWWGYPVEQVASCFTILYAALASFIVLGVVNVVCATATPLIATILLVLNYSLSGYLVTFYADTANAFFFAFFFAALVAKSDPSNYGQRACLLGSGLLGLSLVKSTNVYYVVVEALIWVAYDLISLRRSRERLGFSKTSVTIGIFLLAALACRVFYLLKLPPLSDSPPLIQLDKVNWAMMPRLEYISQTFDFLITEYTLVFVLIIALCVSVFTSASRNSRSIVLLFAIVIFPAINCADYFLSMYSHQSRSLLRYVTTVFYLLPMCAIFMLSPKGFGRLAQGVQLLIALVVFLLTSSLTLHAYPIKLTAAHSGQYKDFQFHSETYAFAQKISAAVGNSSVLITGDDSDHYVGNMQLDQLILRYYLTKNSVGGLYRVDKNTTRAFIRGVSPRYVLVTKFNNKLREVLRYKGADEAVLFKVTSRKPLQFSVVELRHF